MITIIENDGTVTTQRDMAMDADPIMGSGTFLALAIEEMTAPADYDPSFFTFDPFVAA